MAGYLQNVSINFGKGRSVDERLTLIRNGNDNPHAVIAAVMKLPKDLFLDQIRSLAELDRSLTAKDEVSKWLQVTVLAVLSRDGKTYRWRTSEKYTVETRNDGWMSPWVWPKTQRQKLDSFGS